ncbi:RNA helicase [Malassezia cuniculi]|uniref:ATP-dependent DNA helicase CHL1 n=1 Tax=Malassezia cuniculi TaxID=948313 RepID=A0AAF0J698_9BASI|nr:RNA helicase [Malassezia cuniculi]
MSLGIEPPPAAGTPAERSKAYGFPYHAAYDIQLEFMDALFRAIEDKKFGVFESPTGTGKSLSLICGALTWLKTNRERYTVGTLEADDEPDWVVAHAQAKQRAALAAERDEIAERLAQVRPQKRAKAEHDDAQDDDESEFLIREPGSYGADIALSAEVRAAMDAFDATCNRHSAVDAPETRPKVFVASRTHSQLAQLVSELKKTPFSRDTPVRSISLASRRHTCINPTVQRIAAESGTEAMNERCVEMADGRRPRCEFMPQAETPFDSFRDHALSSVCDIEELVTLGRGLHVCPYFGARHSVREAEVVVAPYNMLLHKDTRDSMQLSLDENVVIIDEAHNLIDTVLAAYSPALSAAQIASASDSTAAYLNRFSMQLKGTNEEHLRTLRILLDALGAYCRGIKEDAVVTPSKFVSDLGGTADQINFARLELWLKETRIARKISGYAERLWMKANPGKSPKTHGNRAMHAVNAFLLALADRSANGRIVITGKGDDAVLKYLLLDPADAFAPLVENARSVILAGGTMEPMSEFRDILLQDKERYVSFSCGHIVPQDNILATVVEQGPRGIQFEFGYEAWRNTQLLDELSNAVSNYCNIIPHGVVVFFPSYASMGTTLDRWKQNGALERIAKRKQIFSEPKHTHQVDKVLTAYGAAVASPSPSSPRGAILFAVVGGKLSEGINFSDDLARCVMMIGMPFPNIKSRELAERLEFVRSKSSSKNASHELYVNMCMRAVNQSIGRAIRHANDHAVFLLLDRRYGRPDIRARLPTWIRGRVEEHAKFGSSIGAIAGFFRHKKNNTL